MTDDFSARARNGSDQSLLPSPIHPSDFGEGGDRSRHASIMSHPGSGLLSSSSSFAGVVSDLLNRENLAPWWGLADGSMISDPLVQLQALFDL